MRHIRLSIVMVLVLLMLIACATLQQQWSKLTPDQKARIILNGLQDELSTAFDSGKAYVQANPKYRDVWKQKIVPAFNMANKAVASALKLANRGKMTDTEVYSTVQPLVTSTVSLLTSIGWVKK